MATVNNIYLDQGTTFEFTFDLANVDGTKKDLTNYTIFAQIRRSYYSSTKVDFTTAKDSLEGEITISLTATQTAALKSGRYVYDVEIQSNQETLRVLEGILTVNPEVTR
jgi:hypothetical protein